jgi:putative transposase
MKNHIQVAAPKRSRHLQVGRAYHVVFSTQDCAPVFDDFTKARIMIGCLGTSGLQSISETLAFVVMPDHVHWLFVLKFGSISQCVQRVKAQYSRDSGELIWGVGFHDKAIGIDEDLKATARHIVATPLRAGLVDNVGDYPHWDAAWL